MIREVRVVRKPTKGEEIICLEVHDGATITETLVCLGTKNSVRLPLSDSLKEKIVERFDGNIDWDYVETSIEAIMQEKYR